jgi:tellurite resistance protein TehA-like permease
MGLDIRTPIGVMFSLLGAVVAGYGLLGDKAIYSKSLGININLWWGLVMLAFGIVMLVMAMRASSQSK